MTFSDFEQCYAALGLTPAATWKEVRDAYRRQLSRWHPDRFQRDDFGKTGAEEHSKRIISAYRELASYRSRHGALPGERLLRASITAFNENDSTPVAEPRADSDRHTDARTVDHRAPRARVGLAALVASIATLSSLLFLFLSDEPPGQSGERRADVRTLGPLHPPPQVTAPTDLPASTFTVGATIAEVYDIQGVPTRVEGDTWHFGRSSVRFSAGRVVDWIQHPDHPLKIDMYPQRTSAHVRAFRKGSTKDEVRAVQGTPLRESDEVWDYGSSRVYFRQGHVVGWQESPLSPLKSAR